MEEWSIFERTQNLNWTFDVYPPPHTYEYPEDELKKSIKMNRNWLILDNESDSGLSVNIRQSLEKINS